MLSDSKKILSQAQSEGFAVGHFNTSDLEITKAIILGAEKMKAPVIIGTSEKAISFAGFEELAEIIKTSAEKAKIPIVLHLDHAKSFEICQRAIQLGYTSVMIDGSALNFEENVRLTKKVTQFAHRQQIPVEGELGALASKEKYQTDISQFFTDPDLAAKFVSETKIDSLAIAIGNAHGIPIPEEKLDFTRLAQIRDRVSLPLVLHGASSTPAEDIKKAISLGICKINIDTDLRIAYNLDLRQFLTAHPDVFDPREIMSSAIMAIKKVVMQKIELFGSNNKAQISS